RSAFRLHRPKTTGWNAATAASAYRSWRVRGSGSLEAIERIFRYRRGRVKRSRENFLSGQDAGALAFFHHARSRRRRTGSVRALLAKAIPYFDSRPRSERLGIGRRLRCDQRRGVHQANELRQAITPIGDLKYDALVLGI